MGKIDKIKLYNYIGMLCFTLTDIALFLDTHPNDAEALAAFDKYNELKKHAVDDYVRYFGPLTQSDVNCSNYWTWVEEPWPWQGV